MAVIAPDFCDRNSKTIRSWDTLARAIDELRVLVCGREGDFRLVPASTDGDTSASNVCSAQRTQLTAAAGPGRFCGLPVNNHRRLLQRRRDYGSTERCPARPALPALVRFWDAHSDPDDGYEHVTMSAVIATGSPPALALLEHKMADTRNPDESKLNWMQTGIRTHRNDLPLLQELRAHACPAGFSHTSLPAVRYL